MSTKTILIEVDWPSESAPEAIGVVFDQLAKADGLIRFPYRIIDSEATAEPVAWLYQNQQLPHDIGLSFGPRRPDERASWFAVYREHPITDGEAPAEPVVPDGYVIARIEPTNKQLGDAAFNLCNEFGVEFVSANEQFARAVYRELVTSAAPPQSDAQESE